MKAFLHLQKLEEHVMQVGHQEADQVSHRILTQFEQQVEFCSWQCGH